MKLVEGYYITKNLEDKVFYAVPIKFLQSLTVITNHFYSLSSVNLVIGEHDNRVDFTTIINNNFGFGSAFTVTDRDELDNFEEWIDIIKKKGGIDFLFAKKQFSSSNDYVKVQYNKENNTFIICGTDIEVPFLETFTELGSIYEDPCLSYNEFDEALKYAIEHPLVITDYCDSVGDSNFDFIEIFKIEGAEDEEMMTKDFYNSIIKFLYSKSKNELEHQKQSIVEISHLVAAYLNNSLDSLNQGPDDNLGTKIVSR